MTNQQETFGFQGALWRRSDFHLHSPGAFSFRYPSDLNPTRDKNTIVERFVQQLIDQEIQVAAITDYQGVRPEWFCPIHENARQHGIFVYPGAELSFKDGKYGLHVLTIFQYDEDIQKINLSIQMLDRNPTLSLINGNGQHRDIDPNGNIKSILLQFRQDTNALLIFAHPNSTNGLFKTHSAEDALDCILQIRPDGIEGLIDTEKHRLISTGAIKLEDLEKIASIECSDPHCIEEIGTKFRSDGVKRATYLKLSCLDDLRSLKLALHDPNILINVGDKPNVGYTRFLELDVDGNGFLGGLSIKLSPELNVFVGGRGVGKSAILETIRYVLNLSPYLSTEYKDGLIQFALGSGGKASLLVEQAVSPSIKRFYRFERVYGDEPRVIELNPERDVHLSPLEVLGDQEGPLYFGQREIYEVTRNENQRRRLLDEIIGRQAKTQIHQVSKLEDQLRSNARNIIDRRKRLNEREEVITRLEEIKHRIELFQRTGLADKLREATALATDERSLIQATTELTNAINEWSIAKVNWISRWKSIEQQLGNSESSQKSLLEAAKTVFDNLEVKLLKWFTGGEKIFTLASSEIQGIIDEWKEAKKPLDEEIRKIKQDIGVSELDPDELLRLTREQAELLPKLHEMDVIQGEVETLLRERRDFLSELREARRNVWLLRVDQANKINERLQERVKLEVRYRSHTNDFTEQLITFFRGSGVDRNSLVRITTMSPPVDGITFVDKVAEGIQEFSHEFGLSTTRAQQIFDFLNQDEGRTFDLQLLSPEDGVQVYLKIADDQYQPLSRLSDGQRATSVLLLLLVQEERLLFIDQPEDDLDNRFIYDDIVKILRIQKGKRQLLAATHNPNIPVLGHAELIVALEAEDNQARISTQGAIDKKELQEFVRNVMEGGEEAFRRRAQKYGWE